MKTLAVVLIVPWCLMGCAEAPSDGYSGRPWLFMGTSDWNRVPGPGDSLYETEAVFGPLRRSPWENPVGPVMLRDLPEFWSGTVYADYGSHLRIAECVVEKGVIIKVSFVPFRNRIERLAQMRLFAESIH